MKPEDEENDWEGKVYVAEDFLMLLFGFAPLKECDMTRVSIEQDNPTHFSFGFEDEFESE